jgi:hypothetical protein
LCLEVDKLEEFVADQLFESTYSFDAFIGEVCEMVTSLRQMYTYFRSKDYSVRAWRFPACVRDVFRVVSGTTWKSNDSFKGQDVALTVELLDSTSVPIVVSGFTDMIVSTRVLIFQNY